jgi:hypothetical protein
MVPSPAGSDFADNESNISNDSAFLPSHTADSDSDDSFHEVTAPKPSGIGLRGPGRRVTPSGTAGQYFWCRTYWPCAF